MARLHHAERGRRCSFAAHDRPRGFAAGTPALHLLPGAHERSAGDWSRMQQTRGPSTGQTRAECSRHREVRAVLRRLAGCARSTRAPPRHNSPAEAHLPTFKINSKLYAARPRRLAAARGATQVQPKAHPASLPQQPARPPTHPLRLMRRALLKGEKAKIILTISA